MADALQAVAAWIELEAIIKMIEAATIRHASNDEIETLRERAHEILDQHMDSKHAMHALSRSMR